MGCCQSSGDSIILTTSAESDCDQLEDALLSSRSLFASSAFASTGSSARSISFRPPTVGVLDSQAVPLEWIAMVGQLHCIQMWTVAKHCLCLRFSLDGIAMRYRQRALIQDLTLLQSHLHQQQGQQKQQQETAAITSLCIYCSPSFPNKTTTAALQKIMPLLCFVEDVYLAWDCSSPSIIKKASGFPVRALVSIFENAPGIQSFESEMRLVGSHKEFAEWDRAMRGFKQPSTAAVLT